MCAAGAAAAVIAQATKASGVIVRVEPSDFEAILTRQDNPLVVVARGGFLPEGAEVVVATKIWIPG